MNDQEINTMPFSSAILKSVVCCSCQKSFYTRNNQEPRSKNPYLLNCGHSVCESCCRNMSGNVISCGACGTLTRFESINGTTALPRNAYLMGRILLKNKLSMMDNISYTIVMKEKVISQENAEINYLEQSFDYCYECSKADAFMACQQCDCNFCEACWTKVHSFGKSLQKHVPKMNNSFNLRNIEHCKIHKGKVIEFFCRGCKIYACPNCVVLNHQGENHKCVTLQERNLELFKEVDQLKKDVKLNIRRMWDATKEAKALKNEVLGRDTSYEGLQSQVVQNFVYLHGVLQIAEESILGRLEAAENAKRDRLEKILLQLNRQIETTQVVMREVENLKSPEQLERDLLLEPILDTLTTLKNLPSRLVSSNDAGKEMSREKPEVCFDETVVQNLKNYCTLDIPTSDFFELKSSGSDDVVFHYSEQPRPKNTNIRQEIIRDDDIKDVKLQNSGCSEDSKKVTFHVYPIKSSKHPLSVLPKPRVKPLNMAEGNAYPVCISHVKNPGEFYVMRSSLRKQRHKIDVLATTLVERDQHLPKCVQKDEYYLVQYEADIKWHRARVVDVLPRKNTNHETIAVMYYLDYGNKQEVPLSRLREMPKALRDEPPLAVKCKLYGCVPRNGTWCERSTKVMFDILDKSVLTMYVMKVLPDCLEVDLCRRGSDESLDHELISLRDMMVFLEYASFAVGNDSRKDKKLDYKYLTPVVPDGEETFHGLITYVESESLFYIQKIGPEVKYLLTLMDNLNTAYKGGLKGLIYNPDLGMPCAAIYPQDGKWYRGEITDLPGQEQITVYYVDYGNKEIVHWKSVRKLHPEFLKLAPQAIPCCLAEVSHSGDTKWKLNVKECLEKHTSEILSVFVVDNKDGKVSAMLYTSNDVCVNEKMLENVPRKVAKVSGKASPRIACDSGRHRNRKKQRKKEVSNYAETSENTDEIFRTEVKVLQASSPSDIYVSLLSFSSRAEELEQELQDFYATSEAESGQEWELNDKCAVLSCKRDKWYRATISEILHNDKMRVLFKDVMETEDVPVSNLRILDDRFNALPTGAIKCHLSGIFPAETEWPGLTCEFLQSQLDVCKHVYMTKMGEIHNNSIPIQLWIKKRAQGGALEPSIDEWVVLNDLIVEKGLAVPEKAKLVHHITEEEIKLDDEDNRKMPKIIDDYPTNTVEETHGSFVPNIANDWLPPELCRKDSFVGEPTYVDSDGVIYIHDREDKPLLDLIRASLVDFDKDSKPQVHDQCWSEGQLCIVKYHLDGGWYRGKVLQVNADSTNKVLFVDFGNVETCSVMEMRKIVKHLEIPPLTRRCVLHGVSPVSDDGRWPPRVINHIYSSVVDKCCDVNVVEKATDPFQPNKITLWIQEDCFDMADDLVTLGLAEFVSGNKPKEEMMENKGWVPQVPISTSYSEFEFPKGLTSFPIEILIVKYPDVFAQISYHESVHAEIRKVISDFVSMSNDIQSVAASQDEMEDFGEGVPCISFYSDNGTWYRAEVLNLCTDSDLVLVRYVDYGNEDYVRRDRIRKCLAKWFNVPKMALRLLLYNVRMCDGIKKLYYKERLAKCLFQPGLTAKVIQRKENLYHVEVWQKEALAYQDMIDDGLMEFVENTEIVDVDPAEFVQNS